MAALENEVHLTPKQVLSSLEQLAMELTRTNELRGDLVQQLEANINELYQSLDGDERQEIVVHVWHRLAALDTAAATAIDGALLTKQFANELDILFTELAHQHNKLYEAVEEGDSEHPLVGGLIENVRAEAFEEGLIYADKNVQTHKIVESLGEMLRWHDDSARAIGKMLSYMFGEGKLTDSQISGFFRWINTLGE